jgi:hypothetical protein
VISRPPRYSLHSQSSQQQEDGRKFSGARLAKAAALSTPATV